MGHIDFSKLRRLLEEQGWTSYRVKREKLIGQATWTKIQRGEGDIDTRTICALCEALHVQPGDIMEYIPDSDD